jgi:hypothetical protein
MYTKWMTSRVHPSDPTQSQAQATDFSPSQPTIQIDCGIQKPEKSILSQMQQKMEENFEAKEFSAMVSQPHASVSELSKRFEIEKQLEKQKHKDQSKKSIVQKKMKLL